MGAWYLSQSGKAARFDSPDTDVYGFRGRNLLVLGPNPYTAVCCQKDLSTLPGYGLAPTHKERNTETKPDS